MAKIRYRIHRLEIKGKDVQNYLEQFLNTLEGEVVSIIPEIKRDSLAQIYGWKQKVDYLLIVEKLA